LEEALQDMDAILDAAFRRVFGSTPVARTERGADATPRVNRRRSEAFLEAAMSLAKNGATAPEAAEVLRCHKTTLRKMARKHGFKFRDGRKVR
jgi:hypothetical protein